MFPFLTDSCCPFCFFWFGAVLFPGHCLSILSFPLDLTAKSMPYANPMQEPPETERGGTSEEHRGGMRNNPSIGFGAATYRTHLIQPSTRFESSGDFSLAFA